MQERLQSVSLVITTLMMSFHDVLVKGLNTGFKGATRSFQSILKDTAMIIDIVKQIPKDHKDMFTYSVAGTMIGLFLLPTAYLIKKEKDNKKTAKENRDQLEELEKKIPKYERGIHRSEVQGIV